MNFWHITPNPSFAIDTTPRFEIRQNERVPMLFVSTTPKEWLSWAGRNVSPDSNDYVNKLFAVRVRPSDKLQPSDVGLPEFMDFDPANAEVVEILPLSDAMEMYPNDFSSYAR